MKKRIFRKKSMLLAAALALFAFAGCAGKTEPAPSSAPDPSANADVSEEAPAAPQPLDAASENTVVIGWSSDLKTLDPGHVYEVFGNMITYATYDMLFRFEKDATDAPKPSLVTEDWSLDESRTVYTFPLREDAVFSASGNKLTSADVLFSIERVRNLKSNTYSYVEGIADVAAPDERTIVITLTEPDASFLTKLASNAFCVLDSEVVKANGGTSAADAASADTARDYLDQHSAGSGPYALVSWTPNVELVLQKNPNYWGESGNVDRYILKEIPDPNTQLQMIQKGEIDIAYALSADNIKQLENNPDVRILKGRTSVITFLMMNNDAAVGGPVANPDVQQAVRRAINYQELLDLCGEGALLPMDFVPLGFVGALEREAGYTNLDEAKRLMEKAGYADGFEVTLTTANFDTEGMQWTTIAQKIQSDLAKIGITVKVQTSEIGVVIDEYREGKSPFLVMHWSPDYLDINNQMAFLPGETIGLRAHWPADANAEMVELGAKIKVEADPQLRAEWSEQLQRLMAENSPYAFLLQHPKSYAARSVLSDLYYNDIAKVQLKDIIVS
ncbi:MAG: ABC transporter substrate-binding protein [Clostridiales bacterium]|jgi:peptide/nickel transport system substrate-binding protein|nr:ABC transporter substrate-binding protein [Clostridiales bacterium]